MNHFLTYNVNVYNKTGLAESFQDIIRTPKELTFTGKSVGNILGNIVLAIVGGIKISLTKLFMLTCIQFSLKH